MSLQNNGKRPYAADNQDIAPEFFPLRDNIFLANVKSSFFPETELKFSIFCNLPNLQDFVPYWGRCPKSKRFYGFCSEKRVTNHMLRSLFSWHTFKSRRINSRSKMYSKFPRVTFTLIMHVLFDVSTLFSLKTFSFQCFPS